MYPYLSISLKFYFLFFIFIFSVFTVNAASDSQKLSTDPTSLTFSKGKVLSLQYGGGYSFIEVKLESSEIIFLASPSLPKTAVVGSTINWQSAKLAINYYSHALEREFSQLYMVTFEPIQVEIGIIESIQVVGDNTYLAIMSHQKQLMLILNSIQTKPEFLKGAKIEWLRADSQPHLIKPNPSEAGPLVVEWVRIASTEH
jgi:hypothetical protein